MSQALITLPEKDQRFVLRIAFFITAMTGGCVDIYGPSLPQIAQYFSLGFNWKRRANSWPYQLHEGINLVEWEFQQLFTLTWFIPRKILTELSIATGISLIAYSSSNTTCFIMEFNSYVTSTISFNSYLSK
jgi:hypothetical protein